MTLAGVQGDVDFVAFVVFVLICYVWRLRRRVKNLEALLLATRKGVRP